MYRIRSSSPLRGRYAPALALAVSLAAAACASDRASEHPGMPYPVLEGADFGGMHNVSQCGHVWVGSRPSVPDLELAVRRGVAVVVDVTSPSAQMRADLAQAARDLDLRYVVLGSASEELTDGDVDLFVTTLSEARDDFVLVFCDNGGRSAKLLAIFRVLLDGAPLQAALDDARRCGMKPGADEAFVRAQVQPVHAVIQRQWEFAVELGAHGITANCVAPGAILVERYDDIEWDEEWFVGRTPVGRMGHPDDIAAMVCYLASEQAGFVTAETIYVDGGMTRRMPLVK